MAQFGQNAGPRHLSVFGYVRNIKDKKMIETDCTRKDRDLLGVFGLVWNTLSASLPAPVMYTCESAMDLAGLPRMGTKEDPAESGYTINFNTGPITFPTAIRAPCEGYILQDYAVPVHTDTSFTQYTFSFSTQCTAEQAEIPTNGVAGGNYVDVNLEVVVTMAPDTALVTTPAHNHGTTVARPGVKRMGLAHSWSTHIKVAFDQANATAKQNNNPH